MYKTSTRSVLIIILLILMLFTVIFAKYQNNTSNISYDDLMVFKLLDTPDSRLIGKGQGIQPITSSNNVTESTINTIKRNDHEENN